MVGTDLSHSFFELGIHDSAFDHHKMLSGPSAVRATDLMLLLVSSRDETRARDICSVRGILRDGEGWGGF